MSLQRSNKDDGVRRKWKAQRAEMAAAARLKHRSPWHHRQLLAWERGKDGQVRIAIWHKPDPTPAHERFDLMCAFGAKTGPKTHHD